MHCIEWTRTTAKQLRKLDPPRQVQVRDAVSSLAAFPDCKNVKQLTNHQCHYRLRTGCYRVFFDHESSIRIIRIEEVKKRDERTY